MEQFLLENYSFLTKLVEFIAAITGVALYKKYKNTSAKYFIWFLVYIVVLEFVGGYTVSVQKYKFLHGIRDAIKGTIIEKNYWFYSLFWIIGSSLFYANYYSKILTTPIFKKILKILSLSYIVISVFSIAFNFELFFKGSLILLIIYGGFIILLAVIFYCIETLSSDKLLKFYKTLNFYISATLLVWWLITTPLVFYDVYFSTADMSYVVLRSLIYLFSNIFMYLMFSFALIYSNPKNV